MFRDDSSPAPRDGLLYESHTIETPEQTNIEFTVAGVGSRALALSIDTLIQAGVGVILGILLIVSLILMPSARLTGTWMGAAILIAAFVLYHAYFAVFEILWDGQTPGKRRVGLRVIKDSGRRLSPFESIGRNLLRIVDQLPGFYAVGIIVSLLNKQNKRLGDFVAGSIVVREKSLSEIKRAWQDEQVHRSGAPLGAERLSEQDLILIESFLQRRWDLEPGIRWRIANEVLRKVEDKLTFSPEERVGAERLLEAAVNERRAGPG